MTLAHSRAANVDGWRWRILKAQNPTAAGKGQIYDNGQVYTDYEEEAIARPIQLIIQKWANEINVQTGDYTTITYDSGQSTLIYPPAVSGTGTYTFYVDEDGNTYTDLELCSLAGSVPTPTPEGYLTPSPTPEGYLPPIPTPIYVNNPLLVADLENMVLSNSRASSPDGWRWIILKAQNPTAEGKGQIYDNGRVYTDYNYETDACAVKLVIQKWANEIDVRKGDYVTITYDSDQSTLIYPSAVSGTGTYTFYVDEDGNTYTDPELSFLVGWPPTPTPLLTATPITPTPTPFGFHSPTSTPTPEGYLTPTPTPEGYLTPSPTPAYCNNPLLVADLENMTLAHSRSPNFYGWRWVILKAQNPTTEGKGEIFDCIQSYTDYNYETVARAIKLTIMNGANEIDIREGDYITITYDSGQSALIYPPRVYGIGPFTFYIDEDGNTYTDLELCALAGAVPTLTPTPEEFHSPTPIPSSTATPSLTPFPTPTSSPMSSASPTPTPIIIPPPTPTPIASATSPPTTTPTAPPPTPVLSLRTAMGDYTGDGTADISVFSPYTSLWMVKGRTKAWYGTAGDEAVSRDYDGNGTWDMAVFRPFAGRWLIREVTAAYYGTAADMLAPGDYNGDGTADIALFRPQTGKWVVRGGTQAYYGLEGDVPVPGDYGGNGTTALAVFRPSTGKWLVRGVTSAYYGFATDTVVPGDYTGDGTWNFAVFRPSTGKWLAQGGPSAYWGTSDDTVQPADYDGDGTWDFAVFHSSTGRWLVRGVTAPYYGASTDLPVTNP